MTELWCVYHIIATQGIDQSTSNQSSIEIDMDTSRSPLAPMEVSSWSTGVAARGSEDRPGRPAAVSLLVPRQFELYATSGAHIM